MFTPMKGQSLCSFARCKPCFREKSGGLVVDYIGIAKLSKRQHDYTGRDKKLRRPEHQDNRLSTVRRRTQALPGMYERLGLILFFRLFQSAAC
jgi:hypothetical protein